MNPTTIVELKEILSSLNLDSASLPNEAKAARDNGMTEELKCAIKDMNAFRQYLAQSK